MYTAKIIGNVVCTRKDAKMEGMKLLVVQPVNTVTMEAEGESAVAIDAVGAGSGELVLVVGGSSARQTEVTQNKPTDATIMAIVDHIDIGEKRVYDKFTGAK